MKTKLFLLASAVLVILVNRALAASATTVLVTPIEVTDEDNLSFNRIGGVNLDVNGDGQPDVNCAWLGISINSIFGYDGIASGPRNLVTGQILAGAKGVVTRGRDANDRSILRRYAAGEIIQPQSVELTGNDGAAEALYQSFPESLAGGEFLTEQEGFFVFAFNIGERTHFGWVKIQVDNSTDTRRGSLWILAYGYETEPGTAVTTGAGLAAPLRITSIVREAGNVVLTWSSNPNQVYRVESRASLVAGTWSEISSDVPSGGTSTTFTHTNGAGAKQAFYQIKQLP